MSYIARHPGGSEEPDRKLTQAEEYFVETCSTIGPNGIPSSFADAYRRTHTNYKGGNAKRLAYEVAGPEGSVVRREIARRRAENLALLREEYKATAADVIRRLTQIAFADPREYCGLRAGCCRYCWGINGLYQRTAAEFARDAASVEARNLRLKEDEQPIAFDEMGGTGYDEDLAPNPDCSGDCYGRGVVRPYARDTSEVSETAWPLYQGVKVTRDGVEVKLHSQERALELLGKQLGLFTEKVDLTSGDKPIEFSSDADRLTRLAQIIERARSRPDEPAGEGGS